MKKIEFVYENYVKGLCPSVRNVIVNEGGIKEININNDETNVVFYEFFEYGKLVLNVYASKDITVSEIQRLISAFKFFNINLEFIKYNTIPFTNLCSIEFEVCNDE